MASFFLQWASSSWSRKFSENLWGVAKLGYFYLCQKSFSKYPHCCDIVHRFPNDPCSGTGSRNGTCYTASECSSRGGTDGGSCASGFGVCCTCKKNIWALSYVTLILFHLVHFFYKKNFFLFLFLFSCGRMWHNQLRKLHLLWGFWGFCRTMYFYCMSLWKQHLSGVCA